MAISLTKANLDPLADCKVYLSGRWIAQREMSLSVEDLGFRQGVTLVERLRTYGGRPFAMPLHLNRWTEGAAFLGIDGLPNKAELAQLVTELLDRNSDSLRNQIDVGITLFATPGVIGGKAPTFAIHLNVIDHLRIRQRQQHGQPLVLTDVVQPPDQSWPRSIKVRCRMHYYLADQYARTIAADAVGVLIDGDGTVTETSIANIAIVESGQIISPATHQVLGGITQKVMETIAVDQGIRWSKERITVERLQAAEEVLCMGTDGGLWFAVLIVPGQSPGQSCTVKGTSEIYHRLSCAFEQQLL